MIKAQVPISSVLRKHIDCFYFLEGSLAEKASYFAFPHYKSGLSLFKGAKVHRENGTIFIEESQQELAHIEVLGKYMSPVLVDYSGKVKEVSIVFKPLGINRFFRENYHNLAPQFSQEFKDVAWENFAQNFSFQLEDLEELETFLLSQWCDHPELAKLEESVGILEAIQEDTSITELARKLNYPIKTFQRHFKKHMGCSPIEYRRIYRFRKSIETKFNESLGKTLTEITHESGYFDQSYLIKEFKKLTGHNPKKFFKSTQQLDGDKLIYELL